MTFPASTIHHNPRTGVTFVVEETFKSGGETIENAIVVGGHSIGCRFQQRRSFGFSEARPVHSSVASVIAAMPAVWDHHRASVNRRRQGA